MDDVGSLLAEAAAEVQAVGPRRLVTTPTSVSAEKVFGDMEGESKLDDRKPLSGMDVLKQAATTVANEERDDSELAFKAAGAGVMKSIVANSNETFDDEKDDNGDVANILGRISEDIHTNKIEYDVADIDEVLKEAAAELEAPEMAMSSPDVSDDEETGDEDRNRELILAVAQKNEKSVRWLLSHGASYCCRDVHGWTPLHWAANRGDEDMMNLLLDAAGDERLSKFVNKQDYLSGWTALHIAAVAGDVKCIKILVANKAKNYKKNKFDETPRDGIPFPKSSPEFGACMRALGHDYKSVKSKPPGASTRSGAGYNNTSHRSIRK